MSQRYFELEQDLYFPGCWRLDTVVDAQGQELFNHFNQGKPFTWEGPLRAPIHHPGVALDYSKVVGESFTIVSARVAELFAQRAPQDVQLIPVTVEGREKPYFILNVTRVVRCIDEKASSEVRPYEPISENDIQPEGKYGLVSGMRIDPARVGEAQIFRTWGWTTVIVVSEHLKEALERMGATGPRFTEVTGPSPISDAARYRRDRWRQLREESDGYRNAVWSTLGTLPELGSDLGVGYSKGSGPAGYQYWRIILRPNGRCLLVSHFLSAPFLETELEPSIGYGLELMLETDDSVYKDPLIHQTHDPWRRWSVKVMRAASDAVARSAEVRAYVKAGLFQVVIPGRGLPKEFHTPQGEVIALLGMPSPSLPSSFSTPYGEVQLRTVKVLLPSEAAYIDEQGDAGAAEVIRRFLASGEEHLSLRKRKPVV
jgi:hypothetical protein